MFLQNYRNTSGIENLRALILLKPVRLFYFVHASVTMLMLIPSISANTSAQAPKVAPVVSTSSTSRRCFPSSNAARGAVRNKPSTFIQRAYPLPGTQTVGMQGNRQQIIYSLKETRREQFMRQHLSHLPADFLTAIVFHAGQYMGNFPPTGIIKQSRRPLYRETTPENLFHFIARCIS